MKEIQNYNKSKKSDKIITSDKYCVCVSGSYSECLEQLAYSGFVEFRLDLCELTKAERSLLYKIPKQFIATCRSDDQTSYSLLKEAILLGATFIDLDISRSSEFIEKICAIAMQHGCKLIISYHNYKETPALEELYEIYQSAQKHKPHLVKICTSVNALIDNSTILSLYQKYDDIIAFGMGDMGKVTRLTSLHCGAPYTYTSISSLNSTAKGQVPIGTLKQLNSMLNRSENQSKPIIFIGFMGVGKTTVGRAYAKLKDKRFIDLDEEIEAQNQSSISDLFLNIEELEFRRLEHFALSKILQDENTVISCGGGIVENEDNYSLLKAQDYCIWLDANATYCFNQIEKGTRPLLNTENGLDKAKEIYTSREKKYHSFAKIKIEVQNKTVAKICKEIDDKIRA